MDQDRLNDLVIEAASLSIKTPFILRDFLFKEQLALVEDPARFAAAVCSTRAGKTTACAADLINTARVRDGCTTIYVAPTKDWARGIVWPELHNINRIFDLGGDPSETHLTFQFGNSTVRLMGASNRKEIQKIRGWSNVALIYCDETQLLGSYIKELVEDIAPKRLYDTNGRLRLIGTPGAIPSGYFYDASDNVKSKIFPKWSHHHWTLHANPHIERKSGRSIAQLIADDCELKGVTQDDPAIQRECFGRWVLDTESLLLVYNEALNHYEQLPTGQFTYILGMDFGFEDADAFSVLGWAHGSPDTYLVEELIEEKQTYEQMCANYDKLMRKYPICRVVADPGGGGKKLIESLRPRYLIPMHTADKLGKIANYGLLNNALRTGRFKAKKDSRFASDCNLLEKDQDKSTPDKTVVKGHSDIVDAALYSFKESPAYNFRPPEPVAAVGSLEWAKVQEDLMRNRLYEQIKAEQDAERETENAVDEYRKYSDGG